MGKYQYNIECDTFSRYMTPAEFQEHLWRYRYLVDWRRSNFYISNIGDVRKDKNDYCAIVETFEMPTAEILAKIVSPKRVIIYILDPDWSESVD